MLFVFHGKFPLVICLFGPVWNAEGPHGAVQSEAKSMVPIMPLRLAGSVFGSDFRGTSSRSFPGRIGTADRLVESIHVERFRRTRCANCGLPGYRHHAPSCGGYTEHRAGRWTCRPVSSGVRRVCFQTPTARRCCRVRPRGSALHPFRSASWHNPGTFVFDVAAGSSQIAGIGFQAGRTLAVLARTEGVDG
jgi:hypothetical protein